MTTRQPTAYQLFVREQAPLRPSTISPRDWMRDVGRRWRNRNEQPLINNNDSIQSRKECNICYDERPLTLFNDGPCQHHKEICYNCIQRLNQCPFCRTGWQVQVQRPSTRVQVQQLATRMLNREFERILDEELLTTRNRIRDRLMRYINH